MNTTINVQLKEQRFCGGFEHCRDGEHDPACRLEIDPILIPCPIPRSVTFTVRLGECVCGAPPAWNHIPGCPARPIRVTCSISGKTWDESEAHDVEATEPNLLTLPVGVPPVLRACRARWALVKALVTGEPLGRRDADRVSDGIAIIELFGQRDAVFAALADMARTEIATLAAQESVVELLDSKRVIFRPTPEGARPSAQALEVYIERLIEQVSVLEAP